MLYASYVGIFCIEGLAAPFQAVVFTTCTHNDQLCLSGVTKTVRCALNSLEQLLHSVSRVSLLPGEPSFYWLASLLRHSWHATLPAVSQSSYLE